MIGVLGCLGSEMMSINLTGSSHTKLRKTASRCSLLHTTDQLRYFVRCSCWFTGACVTTHMDFKHVRIARGQVN